MEWIVDRWYGQAMGQVQLHRIHKYYVDTPPFERPVWAKGLAWYVMEKHVARAPECGWDWGIRSDADAVFWRRCIRGRPFAWATGLWGRMEERRTALTQLYDQQARRQEPVVEQAASCIEELEAQSALEEQPLNRMQLQDGEASGVCIEEVEEQPQEIQEKPYAGADAKRRRVWLSTSLRSVLPCSHGLEPTTWCIRCNRDGGARI